MYDKKIGVTVTRGFEPTFGLKITRNDALDRTNDGHVYRQFYNDRSIIGKQRFSSLHWCTAIRPSSKIL